jgi:hypothetical protein
MTAITVSMEVKHKTASTNKHVMEIDSVRLEWLNSMYEVNSNHSPELSFICDGDSNQVVMQFAQ